MRVVWCAHLYPPGGAAGAEWTAHEFLLACQRRGHTVEVYNPAQRLPYEFEGVPVTSHPPRRVDVCIGHLSAYRTFTAVANRTKAFRVWMVHGPLQSAGREADLTVANSKALQAENPGSVLLRPHSPAYRYEQGRRGEMVTLVNLSQWKGAHVLARLVELLPTVGFLGVRGAWDEQQWRRGRYQNLTVWDTQPVFATVLAATRIMICPSRAESWGRVAVEAGHRGIPSVCTPTIGFAESMANDALYHSQADPHAWADEVERLLDDPAWYAQWARKAQRRSRYVEQLTRKDADRVITRLEEACA